MYVINLLILTLFIKFTVNKSILYRENCLKILKIVDCVNDVYPVLLSKIKLNKIVANYQTNCKYEQLTYNWEIIGRKVIKLNNYQNKNILILEPYLLDAGNWIIDLEINEIVDGETQGKQSTMCEIRIKPELPIPIISGGDERTVGADQDFIVDASNSLNLDLKSGSSQFLDFKWQCTLNNQKRQFCDQPFPNRNRIKIPKKFCVDKYVYNFIVNVKTKSSQWVSTSQIVKIERNAVELGIVCLKNCPPFALFTTPKEIVYLAGKCLKNCQKIDENSYTWTVMDDDQFNYQRDTQYGRYNSKFIINSGVFSEGRQYKIQLSLKNNLVGSSVKFINVPLLPTITKCAVRPQQGVALKTQFRINCQYKGDIVNFIVFTTPIDNRDDVVIIKDSPKLENIEFVSPTNVKIFIKMIDEREFSAVSELQIQVKPNFPTNIDENRAWLLINDINNKTENLINSRKFGEAFQLIDGIIEEYNRGTSSVKQQRNLIQKYVLDNLKKIPIITSEMAKSVASLANKISQLSNLPDPYFGLDATNICKNSANREDELIRNKHFLKTLTEDYQSTTKILLKCGDLSSQPNIPEIFNNTEIIITTPYPPLDIEAIVEDYPDYDDYGRETKRVNFERISRNFIEICRIATNTITKTMVKGEKFRQIDAKFCKTFFGEFSGDDFVENPMNFGKISVGKTKNFQNIPVEISVCIWSLDLFWWTLRDSRLLSDIVLIKFRESINHNELNYFDKPLGVNFNIDESRIKEKIHKIEFPLETAYDDRSIVVIKIEVLRNQSFYIEFVNFDVDLNVGVLSMEKPKISDLTTLVTKTNNLLYFINKRNYDNWWYIGVLPQKNIPQRSFNIKIYTVGCYFWNFTKRIWQFSCQGKLEGGSIRCKCQHFSLLSAQINDNRIEIDNLLINHDWTMELIWCPIIFLESLFVLTFYLILLIFSTIKRNYSYRNIYLLADINCLFRYLYVVIIKTGWRRFSGTTSNICIRIIGAESTTLPHLLNYPDPEMKILQRNNEDWFFITSEKSLGDLQELEIWSSFSGEKPSWYCREISIVNVQNGEISKFRLNRWLSFHRNNQIYYKVPIETTEIKTNRFTRILDNCNGFVNLNNPHLVYSEPYEEIITNLSITLTLGFINLLILGLPKFKLNDSFSWITDYSVFHLEMIWIVIVSILITFIGHTVLFYRFKPLNNGNSTINMEENKKFTTIILINIIIILTILIICGFWLPPVLSWFWLTATIIEYLIYFLIVQNIYNFYQSSKLSVERVEIGDERKVYVQLAEEQREFLLNQFGPIGLRSYLSHLYQPLDEDEVLIKRAKFKQTLEIGELLQDTIMFVIYIILLYFVLLADKDRQTIYSNREIHQIISGEYSRTLLLEEIKTIDDIYKYLSVTLIKVMQSLLWYGRYFIKDPGMISDLNNKYTGVVRLRQHRVLFNSCQLPAFLSKNITCQPEYFKRPFFENLTNNTEFDRLYFVWEYTDAYRAGTLHYFGKFSQYPGGGYLAPLGRTLYNSYVNLDYLLKKKWLDPSTRAVFIEFLIYNINSNLFNAVTIVIEISPTGYILIKPDIETFKLLLVNREIEIITFVLFLSFSTVFVLFILGICRKFWSRKWLILRQFWCLFDIIIIITTIIGFCLFLYRDRLVGNLLDELEQSKHNEFVDYFKLIYGSQILLLFAAILLTISTIRLWKLVRYGIMFKIMEKTIIDSFITIFSLFCCQLFIIVAYGLFGFIVFGNISPYFRDVPDTIITLTLLSLSFLQDFNFNSITYHYPIVGYFYYSTFMLITLLIITLYITIIIIHYSNAREYYSNIENLDDLPRYLQREEYFYRNLFKIRAKRLKGGGDNDNNLPYFQHNIEPKADEHRYRDSLTIEKSRLELMRNLIRLNYNKDDADEKLQLMLNIIRFSMVDGDGKEIFFKEKLDDNRAKLISDDRILEMESIVKKLTENDREKRRKLRQQLRYKQTIDKCLKQLDFFQDMLESLKNAVPVINVEDKVW